jgi:hypothetical protein
MAKTLLAANPFRMIAETKMFPHARTLRTSFARKLADTFLFIAGEPNTKTTPPRIRMGLLTYLNVPLFLSAASLAALYILILLSINNPVVVLALAILLSPLGLASLLALVAVGLAHPSISAVLTLVASPIVAIVHGIFSILASKDKKAIDAITVNPTKSPQDQNNPESTYAITLAKLMKVTNGDLEDLHLTIKIEDSKAKVEGFIKGTDFSWTPNKKAEKDQLISLLRLNVGGITKSLEKKYNEEDINKAIYSPSCD